MGVTTFTQVALADGVPSVAASCSYGNSSTRDTLGGTNWQGTVTFQSGPNTGVVQQGDFSYFNSHTLYETTDGPAGNYTGVGAWGQHGNQFCSAFVEPVPGTTNLFVLVNEQGTIASNGQTYVGYGHGQIYQCAHASCTAIPGASGDTISLMVKHG